MPSPSEEKPAILLLDDDPLVLELYQEILGRLPHNPRILTANAGTRALAMLESEPYNILISDLSMPRMDGLQVLSIVRRRFPNLRTVALTSIRDEQFRSRAYALGVDLYLEKPTTRKEVDFFLDCIASLLDKPGESQGGFRGIQEKSLIDLIQMECLSGSSSVLSIDNGRLQGRIVIHAGEIVDADVGPSRGEEALRRILAWKTGRFEVLPARESPERTVHGSYHGILLDAAQWQDENPDAAAESGDTPQTDTESLPGILARRDGVEFAILMPNQDSGAATHSGTLEDAEAVTQWASRTTHRFSAWSETLRTGPMNQIETSGTSGRLILLTSDTESLCIGFQRGIAASVIQDTLNETHTKWDG